MNDWRESSEELDRYFEKTRGLRYYYNMNDEIDDLRYYLWTLRERSIEWSPSSLTLEEIEKNGHIFSGDVCGTSVIRRDNFTHVTFDDCCGNRVSGLFDNKKEIKV
jgi:hypothetical protein